MKVEEGKKYKNIHTGEVYTVTDKIFFNVLFEDAEGRRGQQHYKTFLKNWVKEK